MPTFRRQLTLFVPEPVRAPVEAVRRTLDPRQHALIPAHVTLCREDELEPWAQVQATLATLGTVDVTLAFGDPVQLADGCVLMPVVGSRGGYDDLRRQILGPTCRSHTPHLTLLHPRHAAGVLVDLRALARMPVPRVIHFGGLSSIEQANGGPWLVVAQFGDR